MAGRPLTRRRREQQAAERQAGRLTAGALGSVFDNLQESIAGLPAESAPKLPAEPPAAFSSPRTAEDPLAASEALETISGEGEAAGADDRDALIGYLNEIRKLKRAATIEFTKLKAADKCQIDLAKAQLAHLDSEERGAERQLKLLHKRGLEGLDLENMVLVEIVDHTGDAAGESGEL